MSIKIDLEVQEIEVVLGGLGHLPFGRVEQLVAKIRQQALAQLQQEQNEQPQDEIKQLPDQQ